MASPVKLPDFLVLGAAKAGTTALFRALCRHPQIYGSPVKEPRFFVFPGVKPSFACPGGSANAAEVVWDEAAYLHLFAACPTGHLAGEASATYLASPTAPAVAARYVPYARLIAILRHPVARGYSQWLHLRQQGLEPIADFETAWNATEERMAQGYFPAWHYRYRGFYGRQLDCWMKSFPREQLLILFYEDWLQRPEQTLQAIFRHLGVAATPNLHVTRENVSSRQPRWPWLHHRMVEDNAIRRWAQRHLPLYLRDAVTHAIGGINLKKGPRLDAGLRAKLAVTFHRDLDHVEELTGRRLTDWRS